MSKLPTDREILKCIYEMYEPEYPAVHPGERPGENENYVAIDVPAIAARLSCKPELLFGRLYYHLDQKYRYKQESGSLVPLFYLQVGNKRHVVHFPYLAAVLAGQEQEHRRQLWSIGLSILAIVLSVASLAVNFYKR